MMHMHSKTLLIALLMGLVSMPELHAQAIELNGFAGWQLGGKARLYDGDFNIDDAMAYGGRISVGLSTTTYVEVTYLRSDTEGIFIPYSFPGDRSDPIAFSSNYVHIAGLQEAHFGPLSPFGTIGMGMAIWSPKNNNTVQINSKTQFSMTFGAGVKFWLTDFLGIRLQGSMLMPMIYNGFGFGCGIGSGGSGCGSNLYTRITPFQGEFSGGIILKISPK
jgi:opacity protein-like surface antigen